MNINNILTQLDDLYDTGNLKGAESFLKTQLDICLEDNSLGAVLTIYNELEGLYRTTGRAGLAVEISDKALVLIEEMGLGKTVHHATTLLNGATANLVANNTDKALDMYLESEKIYKNLNMENSYQMASLYNNISHIYQHTNNHEKALEYLSLALELIKNIENRQSEVATTLVAMALSLMTLHRLYTAEEKLKDAMVYYNTTGGKKDGHYPSALSALGELEFMKKNFDKAVNYLEQALDVTIARFGENDACNILRDNITRIKKEQLKTVDKDKL